MSFRLFPWNRSIIIVDTMNYFLHKRRECVVSPLARPLSTLPTGTESRPESRSPSYAPSVLGASGIRFDVDRHIRGDLIEGEDVSMMKMSAESLPENRLSGFRDVADLSPQVRRRAQR